MGVYTRPDSPYHWIFLEGSRARFPTKIRINGGTPAQTKDNKALAEQVYHASMGDTVRERFQLPQATNSVTFKSQADWYTVHHVVKHRGAIQEMRKLTRLIEFFGAYALTEITPTLWTEYETERMTRDGVALSTVGRELAIMKSVLNTAIDHLKHQPLARVKRKSIRLAAKRTITAHEEPAFLTALHAIDPELHDMYLVGVGTLLRQENLIYLQRSEHRGDRLVMTTKTGPHQVLLTGPTELQQRAAEVLQRRMPRDPEGYFFPHWKAIFAPYEDPGHPGVLLRKKIQRAAKAVGIPWGLNQGGIVWHTATRATGATRLLREYQIDIRTVQVIGGWSSLDQMAGYLGLDVDLVGSRLRRTGSA